MRVSLPDAVLTGAVEEAHERVREGRLSRAGRTDDQEPLAGTDLEGDLPQRRGVGVRPRGGQIAQDDTVAERRGDPGRGRLVPNDPRRRLGGKGISDALGRGVHLAPGGGRQGDRGEDLEHRHGNEHRDREVGARKGSCRRRRSSDEDRGERGGPGEQGDDSRGPGLSPCPADHCPAQHPVSLADPGSAGLLGAIGKEYVEAAEVVEEGIGEPGPQWRDRALGSGSGRPAPADGDEGGDDEGGKQCQPRGPRDDRHEDHGGQGHGR